MTIAHHFLLAAMGSAGDVNPMIALGRGLHERGYRVTVLTNPHFAGHVAGAGLEFLGIGTEVEYEQATHNPDLWHPTRSFDVITRFALLGPLRESYALLQEVDPAGTTVVSAGIFLAAHLAREALGLKHITVHLQPSLFRSVYDPPVLGGFRLPNWLPHPLKRAYFNFLDAAIIDRRLAPELNTFRAELGLPPIRHIFGHWLHSPQGSLGLFPEWYAPPPPDGPPVTLTGFIRYDDADRQPLPAETDEFLSSGAPPIVFTPGSANLHAAQFFAESVQAAQLLGRRALLATPYREQVPAVLPDTVHHVAYAPFSELLPRAAALVYHGGIGTLAQTIAAGIPHLVTPYGHDQPDNARRLKRLGIGDSLPPARYRAKTAAQKLAHLLTNERAQDNCRRYAAQVDFETGLSAACDAVSAGVPAPPHENHRSG